MPRKANNDISLFLSAMGITGTHPTSELLQDSMNAMNSTKVI